MAKINVQHQSYHFEKIDGKWEIISYCSHGVVVEKIQNYLNKIWDLRNDDEVIVIDELNIPTGEAK
ncbi:MAG: hypothetical protein LBL65_05480 [Campylobacteraceae bacterium]|jgi:hypothetical protein|nr:hypothetical protein [Campylobacteraceae bacterium]